MNKFAFNIHSDEYFTPITTKDYLKTLSKQKGCYLLNSLITF